MTNCDQKREENSKLDGIKCCPACHNPKIRRPDNFVCCTVWNQENTYRPSTRAVNPAKS